MPIVKNTLFQPLGVLLSDGTMLHLQSREEREVSAADLDAPHLRALLAGGQLALGERDRQRSTAPPSQDPAAETARPAPPEPEPADEPEPRRPKGRRGSLGTQRDDETE